MATLLWVLSIVAVAYAVMLIVTVLQRRNLDPIGPIARWFDPTPTSSAAAPPPSPAMES
jgi:hypothetical protein